MGDSREQSRRMGEWRRGSALRRCGGDGRGARIRADVEAGMEAEADRHSVLLGWRGTGVAGIDRVGGNAWRRIDAQSGGLYQLGRQRARVFANGGVAHAREVFEWR